MGIILTAGIYFIFGLIVGAVFISIGIGYSYYKHCEFNDVNAKRAVDDLYIIGKRIHNIRKNR